MNILVVPTNRPNINDFLHGWMTELNDWDEMIIIEDRPEKNLDYSHYSWKEIDEELGAKAKIISKKDSAIRSFGFLKAYEMGADYIFTLDDDCFPFGDQPFCQRHIQNLNQTPKWTELIPQKRTRGLPYFNKGILTNVVANIGLWHGVPDIDAVESLNQVPTTYTPPNIDKVIPSGQFFPWSGMNWCFKREIAVLTFFPPMGGPYARFDDIWFGIVAKKILDHLNLHITVGQPWVHHKRASDPMVNLVKEAPGIKTNEIFWEVVDGVKLTGQTPKECIIEVADVFCSQKDEYLQKTGEYMYLWVSLF